jgi:hypothetical protein
VTETAPILDSLTINNTETQMKKQNDGSRGWIMLCCMAKVHMLLLFSESEQVSGKNWVERKAVPLPGHMAPRPKQAVLHWCEVNSNILVRCLLRVVWIWNDLYLIEFKQA